MQITIDGNIFGTSGYASHTKQLVNKLNQLSNDVKLEQNVLPPNWQYQCSDAELQMIKKPYEEDSIYVMINLPPFWELGLAKNPKHFIGFCVWEADKIPKFWVPIFKDKRVEQIWVPSNHTRLAIIARDKTLQDKIRIVPHGVNLELFQAQESTEKEFTFIANKGWSMGKKDRGGMQYIIKSFIEEFDKEDNVQLAVKINPAYNNPNYNIGKEIAKLGITKEEQKRPIVKVCDSTLPFDKMPSFYNGNVFITASMGEAFNIPCAEAMACGLPCISTNWGGQIDFVTKENGWLIDYKLIPAFTVPDLMNEGLKWAMPNLDQLKQTMRYCYEHKEEVMKKSKKSLTDISKYSWTNSAKTALKFIKELE